jgi:Translation initiation factor SUI1
LKKAAKMFANRFACGSSVAKNNQNQDEIVVQGDFSDELLDLILANWPHVSLLKKKLDWDRRGADQYIIIFITLHIVRFLRITLTLLRIRRRSKIKNKIPWLGMMPLIYGVERRAC